MSRLEQAYRRDLVAVQNAQDSEIDDVEEEVVEPEPETKAPLGRITAEGYTYRSRRTMNFRLRCDAFAADQHGGFVRFVSAAGDESSTKALQAALQAKDVALQFSFDFDGVSCYRKLRDPEGYKVYRTKLENGLWHMVACTKSARFMPVFDDVALWERLRGAEYTTPIVQAWLPFLMEQVKKTHLSDLTQVGMSAALLFLKDKELDGIVSQGLIDGAITVPDDNAKLPWGKVQDDLDGYMLANGALLGKRAERSLDPLHVPGRDKLPVMKLLREPFEAQAHVIAATAKALRLQTNSVLIAAQIGSGKAQPLDAKLLTPTGWITMGQVKVGDSLVNPFGGTTKVTGVYPQGVKPVFRVMTSDGGSTRCCDDHLWDVTTAYGVWMERQRLVMPLKDIRAKLHLYNGQSRFRIPMPEPARFEKSKDDQMIHPYLLGLLLGDGCMANPHAISFSSIDKEIIDAVAETVPMGLYVKKKAGVGCDYSITTMVRGSNNLVTTELRALGLMGCKSEAKFIPKQYMLASVSDRLELLQGLMDTDGSAAKNGHGTEYSTSSPQLAKDFVELVRSLGGTAKTVLKQTKCLPSYRIRPKLPCGMVPFQLTRKVGRFIEPTKYPVIRMIDAVEPDGEAECQCIAVDSEQHCYITDDYIVTHNTLMGMGAAHQHANGKAYRGLVMCPGHLVKKWAREIEGTIPGARVQFINDWTDVLALDRSAKPAGPEWFIIGRDRAKLGACWQPAMFERRRMRDDGIRCPRCGGKLCDKEGVDVTPAKLQATRSTCEFTRDADGTRHAGCGEQLWQHNKKIWRYEPALLIKRRLKRWFKYLIVDEVHEEKGAATAQANAMGSLASACRKTIALTGTVMGGYANHLRPSLFRLAPSSLVNEGLTWESAQAFDERYGRIETVNREKASGGGADNRQSRGNSRAVTKTVKPGIMPAMFGRHLIDKVVFLQLDEVADNLPSLTEEVVSVPMDKELSEAYKYVEKKLVDAMKPMLARGDKRLLGAMLNCLLCYPDYPHHWGTIGYMDHGRFVGVVLPKHLGEKAERNKEKALADLCVKERGEGRKVWVYVQYTDKHDVLDRLSKQLEAAGLTVKVMRASVAVAKREAWIAKHAPGADVILSHPKLVETGLDFFDKAGTYNVPTLVFYETGYNLFTLRQAAGRAWRIGQTQPCRVYYLCYDETMQMRAIALMGKKLAASLAVEGKFSTEGLVAMGGEEGSMETALARSLVEKMNVGDVRRTWAKINSGRSKPAETLDRPLLVDNGGSMKLPANASLFDDVETVPGPELVKVMKTRGLLCKRLAQILKCSGKVITAARKHGLAGAQKALFAAAIVAASGMVV